MAVQEMERLLVSLLDAQAYGFQFFRTGLRFLHLTYLLLSPKGR